MDWNRLADRCKIFEPGANSSMLIKLLQEGEEELAKTCSIYERKVGYTGPFVERYQVDGVSYSRNVEWILLPQDFARMKWVYVDGIPIHPQQQNESYRDSNNNLNTGSPDGYYVHNDKLYFNSIPNTENILIEYYSNLTSKLRGKSFTVTNNVTIEFDDDDLVVEGPEIRSYTSSSSNVRSVKAKTANGITTQDIWNPNEDFPENVEPRDDQYGFSIDTDVGSSLVGYEYLHNGALNTIQNIGDLVNIAGQFYYTDGLLPSIGDIITIPKWRDLAPVIPTQYHKELCYYALNIATNNDQYLQKWMAFLLMVQEQDMNRDLMHNIKEVI
tara:strand:+ start:427 stop:1410 length:984 start_codon:yes stop_codon:yes gene_type:complete